MATLAIEVLIGLALGLAFALFTRDPTGTRQRSFPRRFIENFAFAVVIMMAIELRRHFFPIS